MRIVVAILALVLVVGGLAAVKYQQISSLISVGHAMEKSGPPPEAVGSALVKDDTLQDSLDALGSVAASRGVTLSNDSPGVVSAIPFESGPAVHPRPAPAELVSNVDLAPLPSA